MRLLLSQALAALTRLLRSYSLPIHKRVEYLSLAVGNAKSEFPSSRGDAVQFLTDAEEKLEVAQVQIEIYRAIEELDLEDAEKQSVLERVEQGLYTISEVGREHLPQRVELNILPQLYSEFAEPYGLLEIVLLIFQIGRAHV